MNLKTPIEELNGITPQYAKRLGKLGVQKVEDLLFHFPSRYEDYSKTKLIQDLEEGDIVTVRGKIVYANERNAFRKRLKIIEAVIEDRTDSIRAVWFNQRYIAKQFSAGKRVLLAGKIALGKEGLYISNPIHEFEQESTAPIHTGRIIPIYPETRGVTSRLVRFAVSRALLHADKIPDPLPENILKERNFPNLYKALCTLHFPNNLEAAQKARARFEFEEMFSVQLAALKTKLEMQQERSPKIKTNVPLTKKFVETLPFSLTESQRKAAWQILKDMERQIPMNRLLEGDVGSGKTVVAAIAALNTQRNNFQSAIMAPTEVLAEQHFNTFRKLFQKHGVPVALYTRSHQKLEDNHISKEKMKQEIALGAIPFVVGTHTLAQDGVAFKNLALVVIDEQHRFGVQQRAALVKKTGTIPHLLSMTATPIPRSLALTVYGDLDITLLREMPEGRKKIITKIVPPAKRNTAYEFIKKELNKGRQAFVIFPLIEQSQKLALRSAKQEFEKLSQGPFQGYTVGLLHGRMKAKEKEEVMRNMKENKIHVLVATSVVEVGIDVPNASIMLVDGADRFGLAQLHQFRGRVGRSEHQSYAFLLTEAESEGTLRRLAALTKAKDGFELAEYDLAFRGSGDLYGVRQSGMPDLAMASLSNVKLIEEAREQATKLLEKEPQLKKYPTLKEKIEDLQKRMHFE